MKKAPIFLVVGLFLFQAHLNGADQEARDKRYVELALQPADKAFRWTDADTYIFLRDPRYKAWEAAAEKMTQSAHQGVELTHEEMALLGNPYFQLLLQHYQAHPH